MEKYNSLEELMGSCTNSSIKSLVSSVLRNNTYMEWSFVTSSVDGEILQAEFLAQSEHPKKKFAYTLEINNHAFRGHISTRN